ncbi:mitochondrial carrier domain-containing protein [Vararia minispora EC-137]|uniref:Mitochondrial carrier domain-containing protein n=1 Tax=Vararia minispora EC-137 TaxID=1314806 RepID=A0ACB8QYP5_9AGAM|nr:mitochondrial carrier domain-containing protein [Vararia minispora EC-137]
MSQGRTKWNVDSMIAGAGGGLVSSIATCPLDVVKTKLQAQQIAHHQTGYLGVIGTVRDVLKFNGFRGLYRGLGPTILGYLPTWAIYFAVYDGIKARFGEPPLIEDERKHERLYPAPSAKGYQPVMREHPSALHILSAMSAGATSTICTNPLWVIKTRFMTQSHHEPRYRHSLDAALTIYRTEGIAAFYRGLLPSLLGIAHVAVQFPLYEKLKRYAQRHNPPGSSLQSYQFLLCSATSKMVASVVTYPHEVVRTRLQTQKRLLIDSAAPEMTKPPGIVRTVQKILKYEGWRGLYKGLSINLFRTVPNSAVTMLTYELLMRHLAHLRT